MMSALTVTALVVLNGKFEEIEAVSVIDILRRADVKVTIASCEKTLAVEGAGGIVVSADMSLEEAAKRQYDCLVLPGGPGVFDMRTDKRILDLIKAYHKANKLIGAICAAPILLKDAGVLPKHYTSHPCVHDELTKSSPDPVVEDGNIITAQGPAMAAVFAFALLKRLRGQDIVSTLSDAMRY
jgi:protein deglycase